MLRSLLIVLTFGATSFATFALAKDHHVIITDFGFFPQISYVKPGDVVHFKNDLWFPHELAGGQNERNKWTLRVEAYGTKSMRVTGTTDAPFNSTSWPLIPAEFSFDDPPDAATADD